MVQGTLCYVGGGDTVMEYDISSGKWSKLPPSGTRDFGMTVSNNQLMVVSGYRDGHYSKKVGVWSAERREWTHPYPDMTTARSRCSAVGYNEWLVVAGGWRDGVGPLSSVEILNTDSKQWYARPPTPTRWNYMKTTSWGVPLVHLKNHCELPARCLVCLCQFSLLSYTHSSQ